MIATNLGQSRRLLSMGLDPATADMEYCYIDEYNSGLQVKSEVNTEVDDRLDQLFGVTHIPAWSLSALLDVMCYCHNVDVEFRKDKNLGWICKWTFYDFDNKKRLDLSKCGETKIEAAFEIMVTLFVQGLIKKGGNDE